MLFKDDLFKKPICVGVLKQRLCINKKERWFLSLKVCRARFFYIPLLKIYWDLLWSIPTVPNCLNKKSPSYVCFILIFFFYFHLIWHIGDKYYTAPISIFYITFTHCILSSIISYWIMLIVSIFLASQWQSFISKRGPIVPCIKVDFKKVSIAANNMA